MDNIQTLKDVKRLRQFLTPEDRWTRHRYWALKPGIDPDFNPNTCRVKASTHCFCLVGAARHLFGQHTPRFEAVIEATGRTQSQLVDFNDTARSHQAILDLLDKAIAKLEAANAPS